MSHHAILVTSWKGEHIEEAHEKARELFNKMVSEISPEVINHYRSFAIFPDGSKEGWLESEQGDELRERFISWLKEANLYLSWVEVQYGDEENNNLVLHYSGE